MDFLAWPAAALIAFIVFVVLFREKVGTLITRLKRAGPVELEAPAPNTQATIENVRADTLPQLSHPLENIVLREREQAIRSDLQIRVGADIRLQNDRLVTHLAATQLAFVFEGVSRLIWGSQLNLLIYLSGRGSVPVRELHQFYDAAVAAHSDGLREYPFERYIAFLTNPGLIVRENDSVRMQPLGREFLAYLARTGATQPRPL
jgi:hypothetical protein